MSYKAEEDAAVPKPSSSSSFVKFGLAGVSGCKVCRHAFLSNLHDECKVYPVYTLYLRIGSVQGLCPAQLLIVLVSIGGTGVHKQLLLTEANAWTLPANSIPGPRQVPKSKTSVGSRTWGRSVQSASSRSP